MMRNGFWIGAMTGGAAVVAIVSAAIVPRAWIPTSARTELARLAAAGLNHLETVLPDPDAVQVANDDGCSPSAVAMVDECIEGPWMSPRPEDEVIGECSTLAAFDPRPFDLLPAAAKAKPGYSFSVSEAECASLAGTTERFVVVLTSDSPSRAGIRVFRREWRSSDEPSASWKWLDGSPRPAPRKADMSG